MSENVNISICVCFVFGVLLRLFEFVDRLMVILLPQEGDLLERRGGELGFRLLGSSGLLLWISVQNRGRF